MNVEGKIHASISDNSALPIVIIFNQVCLFVCLFSLQWLVTNIFCCRVEGIIGSSSNASELNDSGDQAADRQQLEQETIPESSTSRYGRKRTRVLRENYVPWNNIHVDTQ